MVCTAAFIIVEMKIVLDFPDAKIGDLKIHIIIHQKFLLSIKNIALVRHRSIFCP